MKMLVTAFLIALAALTTAYASEHENEMFNQLCVLLDLDDGDKQKLGVAFVTLEENLYAATAGVGDKNADPRVMLRDFDAARGTFRDSVSTFLSKEQFETMQRYNSAIFYAIADDVAEVRVKRYKSSLNLTDDQITKLNLVVSEDLRSVVETFLLYSGDELSESTAKSINASLLEIRASTRSEVKKILDEAQFKKLEMMRG